MIVNPKDSSNLQIEYFAAKKFFVIIEDTQKVLQIKNEELNQYIPQDQNYLGRLITVIGCGTVDDDKMMHCKPIEFKIMAIEKIKNEIESIETNFLQATSHVKNSMELEIRPVQGEISSLKKLCQNVLDKNKKILAIHLPPVS